jgi:hypothetical protein
MTTVITSPPALPSMPTEFHAAAADSGIRIVDPLSIADWDRQVGRLPEATFFHGAAWLRVLHDSYGYRPLYFVQGEPGRPHSVLPVMEVDSRLTGRRGISLPFTDACEPPVANATTMQELFDTALDYGAARGWKYLECRGGRAMLPGTPISTAFHGHCLDLRRDEAALLAGCDGAVRRAIKKAEQNGLEIEFSQSAAAMKDYYRLHCLTRKRHGLPVQPGKFFRAIQRHVLAAGQGWVALARQHGRPVAGAVYFHAGRTVHYKYGASDNAYQHLRANQLVMWRAIQRYAAEGFQTLDLGRSSLANAGLRTYKLNWGAVEKRIDYYRCRLPDRRFITAKDAAEGWHTRIFRLMPVPLLRFIGTMLYRHIP